VTGGLGGVVTGGHGGFVTGGHGRVHWQLMVTVRLMIGWLTITGCSTMVRLRVIRRTVTYVTTCRLTTIGRLITV
jgi:hypothetical protein